MSLGWFDHFVAPLVGSLYRFVSAYCLATLPHSVSSCLVAALPGDVSFIGVAATILSIFGRVDKSADAAKRRIIGRAIFLTAKSIRGIGDQNFRIARL